MAPLPVAKRRKTSHTSDPTPATPNADPTADDQAITRRSSSRLKTPSAKVAASVTAPSSTTNPRSTKRKRASNAPASDKQKKPAASVEVEDEDEEVEVQHVQRAPKRGSLRRSSTRGKASTGPLKESDGNTLTPARGAVRVDDSEDDDVDELGELGDVYALPVSPLKPRGKKNANTKTHRTKSQQMLVQDDESKVGAENGRRSKKMRKAKQNDPSAPPEDAAALFAVPGEISYDQDLEGGYEEPGYLTASEGEEPNSLPDETPPDPRFERIKHIALGRATQKQPIPLINLAEEHAKVHTLLSQTVAAGEGNSMLVIGARGTGKTALVNSILRDLANEHKGSFHVIRLNGFMQTDDKLALREIWRQLGREMEVEDDDKPGARGSNYADTLAKLLQLLSHPDELLPQSFNTADGARAKPVSVDIPAVAAKSVVFVMDEFDLFATHPRQTLLYNLFDIAQSRKAPIAILGLTTRIDVAESLEKRVKSRFSHRYVHLPLPRSFKHLEEVCAAALTVTPADLNPLGDIDGQALQTLLATWNSAVTKHLLHAPAQQRVLHHIFATTRSVPEALTSLILPLSTFNPSSTTSTMAGTTDTALLPPQSSLHILSSLSTLQQGLLIAAARLETILSSSGTSLALAPASGACNFNAAYAEYVDLVARARLNASVSSTSGLAAGGAAALGGAAIGGRVWGREVARGAWEGLRRAGLLVPANSGGGSGFGFGGIGGGPGAGGALRADELVRCDVALEEIEGAVDAGWAASKGADKMPAGLRKWCREI